MGKKNKKTEETSLQVLDLLNQALRLEYSLISPLSSLGQQHQG